MSDVRRRTAAEMVGEAKGRVENLDPARRTILYCASGGRSALAADTLQGMGYGNVAHLDGGIKAWKDADNPVEEIRPG